MIIEEDLKDVTGEYLLKLWDCVTQMKHLAEEHLRFLNTLSELDILLVLKSDECNPHEWIKTEHDKISECTRDLELISAELERRNND